MPFGLSFSQSESQSGSQASSSQFVDPLQQGFLADLFGQASTLANQQLAPISQAAAGLSEGLLTGGQQFIQGLQSSASGLGTGVGASIGGLLGIGGQQGGQPGDALIQGAGATAQGLLAQNPALAQQTSLLQDLIQNNLQATAGTIAGQATLQGSTGGSRQALATGLAGQEAQRQFGQGATALLSQDFAGRQALAPQLVGQQIQAGGLLNQGNLQQTQNQLAAFQGAGGLGNQAQAGQVGAAGVGLQSLGGLFDLGLGQFSAEFQPLLNLAQILGPATVLGESQSSSFGRSDSTSFGIGFGE